MKIIRTAKYKLAKIKDDYLDTTLLKPEGEIPVRVVYVYYPGYPGIMTFPNGDPGYPSNPATLDIDVFDLNTGQQIRVSEQEREKLENEVHEDIANKEDSWTDRGDVIRDNEAEGYY